MRTILAVVLCSSIAFADAPPADAPVAEAPDAPGVSVLIKQGEPAPFDGRLLSIEENLRRGKNKVDCKGTLAEAEQSNVLMPKPVVAALISAAAAAIITSITLGIVLAAKK